MIEEAIHQEVEIEEGEEAIPEEGDHIHHNILVIKEEVVGDHQDIEIVKEVIPVGNHQDKETAEEVILEREVKDVITVEKEEAIQVKEKVKVKIHIQEREAINLKVKVIQDQENLEAVEAKIQNQIEVAQNHNLKVKLSKNNKVILNKDR